MIETLNSGVWLATRAYCTGLEIAALAAMAAGTGMGMYSRIDTRNRMNDAVAAELSRQRQFQSQATPVFEKSLEQSTRPVAEASIADAAAKQAAEYARLSGVPQAPSPIASTPTQASVSEAAGQKTFNQMSNMAAARLAGYSQYDIDQMIKNLKANMQLSSISNLARSSAATLPVALTGAEQANAGLSGAGDLLQGLGGLGLLGAQYRFMKPPKTFGAFVNSRGVR